MNSQSEYTRELDSTGGITQQFNDLSIIDPSKSQMNKFNSGAAGGNQHKDDDNDGSGFMSDFFGDKIANDNYVDDRPIKAKGSYHVPSSQEM